MQAGAGYCIPEGDGMKSIKTVIFDLDGTLFRTETVDIVAVNKALVLKPQL
jgi:hypothetical protein